MAIGSSGLERHKHMLRLTNASVSNNLQRYRCSRCGKLFLFPRDMVRLVTTQKGSKWPLIWQRISSKS